MGELGIVGLVTLLVILAVPLSILTGAVVYVVRLARRGTEATLVDAMKHREFG